MFDSKPSRIKPAAAKIIASNSPACNFFNRVSTLPRKVFIFKSGRKFKICAALRKLDVPTIELAGKSSGEENFSLTNASKGFSLRVIAAILKPSGNSEGTSFKLCTAKSIFFSAI